MLQIEKTVRPFQNGLRFQSFVEFWEFLPEHERIMVDVLRTIIIQTLPPGTREKLTFNVPYFYGAKRICLVWPGSVPCGGFKKGVMLGLCQAHKLTDPRGYLTHGTNKQIFYKIYQSVSEIETEIEPIVELLEEAVMVDKRMKK